MEIKENNSPYLKPKKDFTFNEYQSFAKKTMNPDLNTFEKHLINCALGLTGESGEVAEVVKHYLTRTHEMCEKDGEQKVREKLKKELGDILWYAASMCDLMDWDFGDVAMMNCHKLWMRHGDKFSGHGKRDGEGKK